MKRRDLGWSWKEPANDEAARWLASHERKRRKKGKQRLRKQIIRWMALRARVFKTYGYRCMKCGSVNYLEVDHIKPKSKFPELKWEFSNLQILCRGCSKAKWNYHSTDYREEYVAQELDRETLTAARERI